MAKGKGGTKAGGGCLAVLTVLIGLAGLILTYIFVLDRPALDVTKATAVNLTGPLVYVTLTIANHGKAGARDVLISALDANDRPEPREWERVNDIPSNGETPVKVAIGRVLKAPHPGSTYRFRVDYGHRFGWRSFTDRFCFESYDRRLLTPLTVSDPQVNFNIELQQCVVQ